MEQTKKILDELNSSMSKFVADIKKFSGEKITDADKKALINLLNDTIRQLDHTVEKLSG